MISQAVEGLAHTVIGAAIEVHKELGPGYLESVYEKALSHELELRQIPFERQVPIALCYKNCEVGSARLDMVVGGLLVVELKTAEALIPAHIAQVIRYLKALSLPLGLLLNFDVAKMQTGIRRVVFSPSSL